MHMRVEVKLHMFFLSINKLQVLGDIRMAGWLGEGREGVER